jgi:hypothetical protein
MTGSGALAGLARLVNASSLRASSYDRGGGNDDRLHVAAGEQAELAEISGAGRITHIWMTIAAEDPFILRRLVLRAWWDGEPQPSVEVPVGDFFGMGHALTKSFWSLPLQMAPEDGRGFSCYFPMPFESAARWTIENESDGEALVYYYIDYELYDDPAEVDGLGRFHAQWRRENPTTGVSDEGWDNRDWLVGGEEPSDPAENYVILEAAGRGHFAGCHLDIENLRDVGEDVFNWYGEGDDMFFIDGESWPPALHGTGTEDYFGCAWCPTQEYSGPYHGIILPGGPNWSGKISLYRYHIEDPVRFRESIRVTIEHGHANRRGDDVSSTAYWYQTEPHLPFPALLPVDERLPRRSHAQ